MRPVVVDDGKHNILVKWRGRYRLPHNPLCAPDVGSNLI